MTTDLRMPKSVMDYLGLDTIQRCPHCGNLPSFLKENTNGEESWFVYCKGVSHVIRSIRKPTLKEAIKDWNEYIEGENESK